MKRMFTACALALALTNPAHAADKIDPNAPVTVTAEVRAVSQEVIDAAQHMIDLLDATPNVADKAKRKQQALDTQAFSRLAIEGLAPRVVTMSWQSQYVMSVSVRNPSGDTLKDPEFLCRGYGTSGTEIWAKRKIIYQVLKPKAETKLLIDIGYFDAQTQKSSCAPINTASMP